jgi:hypothetical protein
MDFAHGGPVGRSSFAVLVNVALMGADGHRQAGVGKTSVALTHFRFMAGLVRRAECFRLGSSTRTQLGIAELLCTPYLR